MPIHHTDELKIRCAIRLFLFPVSLTISDHKYKIHEYSTSCLKQKQAAFDGEIQLVDMFWSHLRNNHCLEKDLTSENWESLSKDFHDARACHGSCQTFSLMLRKAVRIRRNNYFNWSQYSHLQYLISDKVPARRIDTYASNSPPQPASSAPNRYILPSVNAAGCRDIAIIFNFVQFSIERR